MNTIVFDTEGVFDALKAIRDALTAEPAAELDAIVQFMADGKNVAAGRKAQQILKTVEEANLDERQLQALSGHLDKLQVASAEFEAVLARKARLEGILRDDVLLQVIDHRKDGGAKAKRSEGRIYGKAAPEQPRQRRNGHNGRNGTTH